MKSDIRFADISGDPHAIIARSTCGTAIFFISYACQAIDNGSLQHGFWLSLCLGLIGCMATGQRRGSTHS